jgi:hypothetical protein
MRWIYNGPYRVDALHEGHPEQDGTGALVAVCGCGWRGTPEPITAEAASRVQVEWELYHLHPLIEEAAGVWPAWADRVGRLAAIIADDAAAGRHHAAHTALKRLSTLAGDGSRRVAEQAIASS